MAEGKLFNIKELLSFLNKSHLPGRRPGFPLVWHKVARLKSIQDKMRTFQRNALMTMGNLRPSTPTRALEVACYLLPLELQLRKIACESYFRCKNFEIVPLHDTYTTIESHKGHRQLCEEFLRDLDVYLLDCPSDRSAKTTYFLNNKYEVDFDSMVQGHSKRLLKLM